VALNYCGSVQSSLTVNVKNSTDVVEHNIKANIYPNPTHGIITIEAQNMQRITISNTLGQVLIDVKVEDNETRFDMSRFAPGIYLINIYTDNGNAQKRVNVIR